MSAGIETLKRRADALSPAAGNVVLIYPAAEQPDDRIVEYVLEVKKRGDIPIVLDSEDRDL